MLLALLLLAVPASGQEAFPSRPVTIVVPFAPGGPTDTTARLVAEALGARLGQRFLVENTSGAGGTLGAARVARAPKDGYTLLLSHLALPGGAALYANLPFDTATAFAGIGLINFGPMILVGRPDLPARDVAGFAAWAKAQADRVNMANAGIGSPSHLCSLFFQQRVGVGLNDIAYRGTAPAIQDMLGGRVDALCDLSTNALPHIQAGSARAYAVTTRARLAILPAVPTLAEALLPEFEMVLWNGLFAPAGTPRAAVLALNAALGAALEEPAFVTRLAGFGTEPFPPAQRTPEAAEARLAAELQSIGAVIRAMGVPQQR